VKQNSYIIIILILRLVERENQKPYFAELLAHTTVAMLGRVKFTIALALASHAVHAFVVTNGERSYSCVLIKQQLRPHRSEATTLFYHDENEEQRRRIELTNSFLKASRSSFKKVEGATDSLLDKNPVIAMMIFLGAGLLVAYVSGFAILDGYIDVSNPMDNAAVPYWDEDLATML
jgi:hypothetical protein